MSSVSPRRSLPLICHPPVNAEAVMRLPLLQLRSLLQQLLLLLRAAAVLDTWELLRRRHRLRLGVPLYRANGTSTRPATRAPLAATEWNDCGFKRQRVRAC
eukprot:1940026-Pleurochrysis_carterae.AAC.1